MSTRGCVTGAQRNEKHIYQSLRGAIGKNELTQKECGEILNVTQSGFSYLINHNALTVKQICELADEMGLEVRLCVRH